MTIVDTFDRLTEAASKAFSQRRTFERVRQLAYGFITAWGRHPVSQALCAMHAQFKDWSASYRLFSRVPWTTP